VKIGKVWGVTEQVPLGSSFVKLHKLTIKPNARCSDHVHRKKWNAFMVVQGRLFIDVRKKDYPLVDTTELGPGDVTTVSPDEFHLFRTGRQPVIGFEMYYPAELTDDIERKNCGAVAKAKTRR